MFGPPVPIHLTPFMEGRGRPADDGPLDGDGRRSIYLSVPQLRRPLLTAFDTPPPATTAGPRTVSNVPGSSTDFDERSVRPPTGRAWGRRRSRPVELWTTASPA